MKKPCLIFAGLITSASAHSFCFSSAADRYNVDADLLRAIAQVESSMNPKATNRNKDGSEDIGLLMINDRWLKELETYDIKREDLFNPCTNVNVGAWVLSRNIKQYGRTWRAVGAYNARSEVKREIYVKKVWNVLKKGVKK